MDGESRISIEIDGKRAPAAPRHAVKSAFESGGFVVENHAMDPAELPEHAIVDHRLAILTGASSVPFEFTTNGRRKLVSLHPGQFSMQNHGDVGRPRWFDKFEFLAIAIKPTFFEEILSNELDAAALELITQRNTTDEHITGFAHLFQYELLCSGLNGRLYSDALSMAFAIYLLNEYSNSSKRISQPKGKLQGLQLKRLLDYAHSHMADDLDIQSLAAQVNLSPFHFAKTFKGTTGLSPHQFVMRLRIEKAVQLLKSKSLSLTQIAHATGFYDQSHFIHSFKRVIGLSPKKYLKAL